MFDLSTEEAQLLLETGLMAIGQNRFTSAMKILMALEQYRSGHESLDVAKVILCLSQFQGKIALEFLDNEALPRHPDSRMLKAFRCMALIQLKRGEEARPVLWELQNGDDNAANLAKGMLENL
jgi:hypothetical protein